MTEGVDVVVFMLSPSERSTRARIGAHSLHATHDPRLTTANGRTAATKALNTRLLQAIDPDNMLSEAERQRRLEHARSAHFSRLALKRMKGRRS